MGLLLFFLCAAAAFAALLFLPARLEVEATWTRTPHFVACWLGHRYACPGGPAALALADLRRLPGGRRQPRKGGPSPLLVIRLVRLWIRLLASLTHRSRGKRFSLHAGGGVGDAAVTGLLFGGLGSVFQLMGARLGVRPEIETRPVFAAPSLRLSVCGQATVRLVDLLWSIAVGLFGR